MLKNDIEKKIKHKKKKAIISQEKAWAHLG